ncbi:MAG: isoprenylcysteine carboxylmethyltransferase family protein [Cyanobacteria bacterium P01_F01_bin.53]
MTITIALAYLLILGYFVIERSLRQGTQALSLNRGIADAGSSKVLWLSGAMSLLLVIAAPTLNAYSMGYLRNARVGWIGLAVMASGLALRYWAAKTLGKFYTRTLQISEEQALINQPPYNVIRHPGYLGTLLLEVGAGLAVTNWIVLLAAVIIGMTSKAYRINAEENMLEEGFGEQFQRYSDNTWKLLPFIY